MNKYYGYHINYVAFKMFNIILLLKGWPHAFLIEFQNATHYHLYRIGLIGYLD